MIFVLDCACNFAFLIIAFLLLKALKAGTFIRARKFYELRRWIAIMRIC